MTRREFIYLASALSLGCGGDRTDPPIDGQRPIPIPPLDAPEDASPETCTTTTASISMNHGHVANVPAEDVNAGITKTYDIQGTSTHPHSITVTGQMFATMRDGEQVMVTSTSDAGHTHVVTLTCVVPAGAVAMGAASEAM